MAEKSSKKAKLADKEEKTAGFVFSPENFKNPDFITTLPNVKILDIPVIEVKSNKNLEGYGYLVDDPADFTCEKGTFEIKKWPVSGWRQLDPNTGDEAGTTEGDFEVHWKGDFYYGKNLAINTINNSYLDGVACADLSKANKEDGPGQGETEAESYFGNAIYLWMSDYHPDGGQMFFARHEMDSDNTAKACTKEGKPVKPDFSFFMCLGKNTIGDDVKPTDMVGFKVPAGKGVYIHPGTWHNGFYINKKHSPCLGFTRQGRVHARVSASWVAEHGTMLRMKLE